MPRTQSRQLHREYVFDKFNYTVPRVLSNKEIADGLFISVTTVKSHVKNILRKLDVPSRTAAVLYAARIGLASLTTVEP